MTLQKVKVYELAKELGLESFALLEKLKQLDIDVKSHMSSLGSEETRIVKDHLAKEKAIATKASKAAAKKSSPSTEEKRVTSTVIRRRSKSSSDQTGETGPELEAAPAPATKTRKSSQTPKVNATTEAVEEHAPTPAFTETPELTPVESEASVVSVEEHSPESVSSAKTSQESDPVEAINKNVISEPAIIQEPSSSERLAAELQNKEREREKSLDSETTTAADSAKAVVRTPVGSSFDIIKVIPKAAGVVPPKPADAVRPVVPPIVRPRSQITITQKAAPQVVAPVGPPPVRPLKPGERPQFGNRPGGGGGYSARGAGGGGTFHRTPGGGGPGLPRPGGFGSGGPSFGRPGGGFGGGGGGFGRAPLGGMLPVPPPPTGSRHGHDKTRNQTLEDEMNLKKRNGLGRLEKEEIPVEDIKLTDYRAKKELIFIGKKKRVPLNREVKRTEITTPAAHKRVVKIEGATTVSDLANRMGIKANDLIKKLMGMGVMAGINQSIDFETASLIATEFGFEIENVAFKEDKILAKEEDKDDDKKARPPIVTVMGHVDHGKTSLLDAIRSANVASGEAGGITQHIGAYSVEINGKPITFIDTPGHEAFTMMRARGANVTDIVILVVAADDGIMPQTREAIDHARSAGVPIIVAINKIDKPAANRDKVLKQLAEADLLAEEWGGEVMTVNVSALKKTGIKELLEGILLQAEVLDLKANPDRLAEGTLLEAKLDKSRGAVATVLVKRGSLSIGDSIVAGTFVGRVRAMIGSMGQQLKVIGPSMAAEILGLEGVPTAGDSFNAVNGESEARELQSHRVEEQRRKEAAKNGKLTLEEIFGKIQKGDLKELPIILKTDVFGSSEALKESLSKLSNGQVKVKLMSTAVGGVTESDVLLASASGALILGFNVRPDNKARQLAEQEKIEIKTYSIIYELIDDVKKAMTGLLPKKAVERYLGRAEVRSLFSIPSIGVIAGSAVVDGKILRNAQVRLLRENRVVYTGKISSLRRFKDDAKEVVQGYECGIGIENYRDLKMGDVIEAFTIDMVAQELEAPSSASTGTQSSAQA